MVEKNEAPETAALQALLEVAACPEDHQPLRLAPGVLVTHLNALIETRALRCACGDLVTATMQAALIRQDNVRLYPVREGIAVLLQAEAILLQPEDVALI